MLCHHTHGQFFACTNITYCSSYLQQQCPLCQYLQPQCSAAYILLMPILLTAAMPIVTTPMAAMLYHNMHGQYFAYINITDRSNVNFSGNSHALAAAMSLTAVILLTVPTRRINTISYTNGTCYYL